MPYARILRNWHLVVGLVNQCLGALVKQLKIKRKVKFCIEKNTFLTLKK